MQQLFNHALHCHQTGNLREAEAGYRQILQHAPQHPEALHYLGVIAAQVGDFDAAVSFMEQALKVAPRNPYLLNDLGETYKQLGRLDQSFKSFRQALKHKPDFSEAVANLGAAFEAQGNLAEASTHFERALKLDPHNTVALINKGRLLQLRGAFSQAASCYESAIKIDPGMIQARVNLGSALLALGQADDAVHCLQTALSIDPTSAETYGNLGLAFDELGLLDEAVDALQKALTLQPNQAKTFLNLGSVLLKQGQLTQSIDAFKRALSLKPDYVDAANNLLLALLYHPTLDADTRFDALCLLERQFGTTNTVIPKPFTHKRHASKKLRIGYVSSDFRNHPVGRNTQPLIRHHDRSKFEIYLYADVKRPDEMTEWFKNSVDYWRTITGITDQVAAEMIRRDQIDILILLAGRFDENRPLIAIYRAAPVQVSLYDGATSGLKSMDYFLADNNLAPKNTNEKFTERVVRLPTFYVHAPLINMPPVSDLPAKNNGYITFGSFNNPAKLNEHVVALWAGVLKAIPNSRLLLKYKTVFAVESVRQHYLGLFQAHGVEAHRIELASGRDNLESHLARYAQIDVVLDPFPFTGATATFESLWMGVPVVTLMGDCIMGRWSGAMLKKIGLDNLVAASKDEYIEIARQLAEDVEYLSTLRANLRERVAQSPLCDEHSRARQIEKAYRWMWEKRRMTDVAEKPAH